MARRSQDQGIGIGFGCWRFVTILFKIKKLPVFHDE
jgi:hypothetical protein